MNYYSKFLLSNNIANALATFLLEGDKGELEVPLRSALSKSIIQVPVRHQNIVTLQCIYEHNDWVKFYNSKSIEERKEKFRCPGCRQSVGYFEFGVDYILMQQIKLLNIIDPQRTLYMRDKLIVDSQFMKFYAFSGHNRFLIPGSKSLGNQNIIGKTQVEEQMAQLLYKLKQYIIIRKIKKTKQKNYSLTLMNQKLESIVEKVTRCVQRNINLLEQDKTSINQSSFVFGLKTIIRNNKIQSILIVYYIYYKIWLDFDLILDGQPYLKKDGALYLKQSNPNQLLNYVYIIGGQSDCNTFTDEFLKVPIPKDPFTKERILKIEKLQNLKQPGVNFLGTIHNNKIFIFHGQQCCVKNKKYFQEKPKSLDFAQFFWKGAWYNLNTKCPILPRFDGSSIVIHHKIKGKCLVLFGGVKMIPRFFDKLEWVKYLQEDGQIFQCNQEQFMGNSFFTTEFLNYRRKAKQAISTPIFSVPHFRDWQLLILGGENREIFSFNWDSGVIKLNRMCSVDPIEYELSDISDQEGCVTNNIFYTIQFEKQKHHKGLPHLLKINLTTGIFTNNSFIERAESQQACRDKLLQKANQSKKNQQIKNE